MASFLHLQPHLPQTFRSVQGLNLLLHLDEQKYTSYAAELSGQLQGKEVKALKSYRLEPNATFSQKIQYVLYRLWNAVKAVFGRSDWQVARKNLTEVMVKHDITKSLLPYETKLSLDKIYASSAETLLYLSIDSKFEAFLKDIHNRQAVNSKIEKAIEDLLEKKIGPFVTSVVLQQKVDAKKVCEIVDEALSTLGPIFVDGDAIERDTYESVCQSIRAFKPLLEEYLNHSSVQE